MKNPQSMKLTFLIDWFNRKTNSNAVRRVGLSSIALATDLGLIRNENQDRCAVMRTRSKSGKSIVLVTVCDGMGGMESGSDCSSSAIAAFMSYCAENIDQPPSQMLVGAVHFSNDLVYARYQGRGGATLSAICVTDEKDIVGVNIGDSRIYGYRDNHLTQISIDDTLAGRFNSGPGGHLAGNELLQYIGAGADIAPQLITIPTPRGHTPHSIISSDGVHYLDSKWMQSLIQNSPDSAKAAQRLVDVAKWCGGKDNATVAIIWSCDKTVEFSSGSRSDLIEIWDPFGEVQIYIESTVLEGAGDHAAGTIGEPPKDLKRSSPRKKRKKKQEDIATSSDHKDSVSKEPLKKPQIKIQFDDMDGQ